MAHLRRKPRTPVVIPSLAAVLAAALLLAVALAAVPAATGSRVDEGLTYEAPSTALADGLLVRRPVSCRLPISLPQLAGQGCPSS